MTVVEELNGQHFITFQWGENVRKTAVEELMHGCVVMMASVGAIGQHFFAFLWAENVHETAVELQNGCVATLAFVGAVEQHFIIPVGRERAGDCR